MAITTNKPRVLIVDDDEVILELAATVLTKAGMLCSTAKDGGEGLTKARKDRPDIIIIDRNMPIMSGNQAIGHLNKDALTSQIPVIMLTGSTLAAEVSESLALGVDDYIVKPFAPEDLIARVQRVLKGFSRTNKKKIVKK
ncbi:MAG: response regulator [Proteobacteria bacterium]|nr:response regulator [Pseudomonadota bacterium]